MSKENALRKRREWLNNKKDYCIVDTETTGLGKNDKVIEIATSKLRNNNQEHRALGDCKLCLKLINSSMGKKEEVS